MAADPLADLFAEGLTPERDAAFVADVSRGIARVRMVRLALSAASVATAVLLAVSLAPAVGELVDGLAVAIGSLADPSFPASTTAIMVLTACGLAAAWVRANA